MEASQMLRGVHEDLFSNPEKRISMQILALSLHINNYLNIKSKFILLEFSKESNELAKC
jgi:hypothetical protein